MSNKWASIRSGFTIVELLIVIVVVGILATIVLVSYNGIQQRAYYGVMQTDLDSINKAIQLYYAKNNSYPNPSTSSKCITATSNQTLDIPGLVPEYISKIPSIPDDGLDGYYVYCRTVGTADDYKLVRLVPEGVPLPAIEQTNPHPDPKRPTRGWGFWSSDFAGDDL